MLSLLVSAVSHLYQAALEEVAQNAMDLIVSDMTTVTYVYSLLLANLFLFPQTNRTTQRTQPEQGTVGSTDLFFLRFIYLIVIITERKKERSSIC